MTTAGTLYDETVGGGFAKLLTSTVISSGTGLVGFTLPSTHDAFLFDIESLYCAVEGTSLIMRVSTDNGATWISTASYYWSMSTIFSYNGNVWNPYGSASMGAPYDAGIGWSHGWFVPHPLGGRVRFFQMPGNLSTFLFRYSNPQQNYYTACNVGSGWWTTVTPINAIAFIPYGTTFNSGTIRMYGMRKG